LVRRLAEHNSGKTRSLKFIRPLVVVFSKTYPDIASARKAEILLKKSKSRIILEKIIKEGDIKLGP